MSDPLDLSRFITNRLKLVTDSEPELITTAEIKEQARITGTEEDTLLDSYVVASRKFTEKRIGRFIRKQTWKMRLLSFPGSCYIPIPRPPLIALDHIKYTDRDGVVNTLIDNLASPAITSATVAVELDTEPGFLYLTPNNSWPTDSLYTGLPVEIQFQAGLAAPVDEDLVQGLKLLAGHWAQHREAVVVGSLAQMNALATGLVPLGYEALVNKFEFAQG